MAKSIEDLRALYKQESPLVQPKVGRYTQSVDIALARMRGELCPSCGCKGLVKTERLLHCRVCKFEVSANDLINVDGAVANRTIATRAVTHAPGLLETVRKVQKEEEIAKKIEAATNAPKSPFGLDPMFNPAAWKPKYKHLPGPPEDAVLSFGAYEGKTISTLSGTTKGMAYLRWLLSQPFDGEKLKGIIQLYTD